MNGLTAETTDVGRAHKLPSVTAYPPDCEVAFRIITFDNIVRSKWACIKKPRGPVDIPQAFDLETAPGYIASPSKYCAPGSEKVGEDGQTCRWNGIFRDSLPFSFEFYAPQRVDKAIGAIRIFRNGRLRYAWKHGDALTDPAGQQLLIPGTALKGGYPVHLSDLGLYVAPAGVVVDDAAVVATANDHAAQWSTRLASGLKATITDPTSPITKYGLVPKYECFQHRIEYISQKISAIQSGKVGSIDTSWFEANAATCTTPQELTKRQDDELRKILDEAARHIIDTNETARRLAALAKSLSDATGIDVDAAVAALKAELQAKSPKTDEALQRLANTFQNIDAVAAVARGQAEDTVQLIQTIKKSAVKDLSSPEAQLAIYKSFAAGIGDESALFEDRQANPTPILSEGVLSMKYHDRFQKFYIAAWSGLPIAVVADSAITNDINVTNLIPIVDLFGARWQGRSSWMDLRLAFGVLAARETQKKQSPAGAYTELTNLNAGPQLNFGFGSLKIGAGYMVREDDASATSYLDAKNIRVLLGADIVKLITGRDAQLVTSTQKDPSSGDTK